MRLRVLAECVGGGRFVCLLFFLSERNIQKRSMNARRAPNAEHILFGRRHSSLIVQSQDPASFCLHIKTTRQQRFLRCRPDDARARHALTSAAPDK